MLKRLMSEALRYAALLMIIAAGAEAQQPLECVFTDVPIVAGRTPVRAQHINELRNCLRRVLQELNDRVIPPPPPAPCEIDLGTLSGTSTVTGRWDGNCPYVYAGRGFGRVYRFNLSQEARV